MTPELIRLIHLLIVLAVVTAVFIPICLWKIIVLGFIIFMIIKIAIGYNECELTALEYQLQGKTENEPFIYRLFQPYISVSKGTFHFVTNSIMLVIMLILIYQIHLC